MPQLRHGARRCLNHIYDDLDDAFESAKADPELVRGLITRVKQRMIKELEPMLERAAPQLEQRVAALEQVVQELQQGRIRRVG